MWIQLILVSKCYCIVLILYNNSIVFTLQIYLMKFYLSNNINTLKSPRLLTNTLNNSFKEAYYLSYGFIGPACLVLQAMP